MWPEIWKDVSKTAKQKEKQKWAIERPKLDNARKLRGIYLIDPEACKSKFACIVEANESTRMRSEGTLQQNHENHIAGKGSNSLNHYNLVHKFNPMLQAMKIQAASG